MDCALAQLGFDGFECRDLENWKIDGFFSYINKAVPVVIDTVKNGISQRSYPLDPTAPRA